TAARESSTEAATVSIHQMVLSMRRSASPAALWSCPARNAGGGLPRRSTCNFEGEHNARPHLDLAGFDRRRRRTFRSPRESRHLPHERLGSAHILLRDRVHRAELHSEGGRNRLRFVLCSR